MRSSITDFTPLVQRISIAAILYVSQSFRVDVGWAKMPLLVETIEKPSISSSALALPPTVPQRSPPVRFPDSARL
jgi:hypothetical protein